MILKQIEAMAVNAAQSELQARTLSKCCESLTIEETQYFLTIFSLIKGMSTGAISKQTCTEIKEFSRRKMMRFQNWQENTRKFYSSQIRNLEHQRIERQELIEKIKVNDSAGTLKAALKLVDNLTGENIYFKMSQVLRSGISDQEFDQIVNECTQFLVSPVAIKEQIKTIVNLINET